MRTTDKTGTFKYKISMLVDIFFYILIPGNLILLIIQKYYIESLMKTDTVKYLLYLVSCIIICIIFLVKDKTFECGSMGKKLFHFKIIDTKTNSKPLTFI